MSQAQRESYDLRGAIQGRIAAIAVTSSAGYIDLTASSATIPAGLANDAAAGALLSFVADGCDVYVAFSNSTATAIDDTDTTTAARSAQILEGVPYVAAVAYKGNTCYKYLHYKAATDRTGVLRIWRATGDPELSYV